VRGLEKNLEKPFLLTKERPKLIGHSARQASVQSEQ